MQNFRKDQIWKLEHSALRFVVAPAMLNCRESMEGTKQIIERIESMLSLLKKFAAAGSM